MHGTCRATLGVTRVLTRSWRILPVVLGVVFGGAIAVAKAVLTARLLRWRQSEGTVGSWSILRSRGCGVVRRGVKLT